MKITASGELRYNNDILSDSAIPWDMLKNRSVMVTGATGLIGSGIIRALAAANAEYGLNLCLTAHGRDRVKAASILDRFNCKFIEGDIREPIAPGLIPPSLDYVFHCASVTKSSDMVSKPVLTIETAVDGTKNILGLARERHCESFVYLSSMEVYGVMDKKEVRESDLGYLDLSNPRSGYPESKRLCEAMCAAYSLQYGLPVKIARLAQTFGFGTPYDDTRVFAQFARSALLGNDIELNTAGKSRGNYCYISDAVRALLIIALKGADRAAYNIANPAASVTIREMADTVAREMGGGKIKVIVPSGEDIKSEIYAPETGYLLNSDKLKALGWNPKYGLEDMYWLMLEGWRETKEG